MAASSPATPLGGRPGTFLYQTGPMAYVPGLHSPVYNYANVNSGTPLSPATYTTTGIGQVVDSRYVQGTLVVAHDDVTIRNCRMWALSVADGIDNLTIEWSRIGYHRGSYIDYAATSLIPQLGGTALQGGGGIIVRRTEIFGFSDLFRPRWAGGVYMRECHLHSAFKTHDPFFDGPPYNDPSANNAHSDSIQFIYTEVTDGIIQNTRQDNWAMEAGDFLGSSYWENTGRAPYTSGLFINNPGSGETDIPGTWYIYGFHLDGNYSQGFYWQNNTGAGTMTPWYVSDGVVQKRASRANYGTVQWGNVGYSGNPGTSTFYYGRVLDVDTEASITVADSGRTDVQTPPALSTYPTVAAPTQQISGRSITRGGSSTSGLRVSGSNTGVLSYAATGTNPYLVVPVMTSGQTATSVTFGATNLALIPGSRVASSGGTRSVELWGGFVPATSANITVTLSASGDWIMGASHYNGVDNSIPVGDVFTRTSTSNNIWYGTGNSQEAQTASLHTAAASYAGETTVTASGDTVAGGENESGIGTAAGVWGDQPGNVLQDGVVWSLGSSQVFCFASARLQVDVTPPARPTINSITPSATGATVSVTMPADADTAFYRVRVVQGDDFFYDINDGTQVLGQTATTPSATINDIAVSGLLANTLYTLAVFAEDNQGNISLARTQTFTTTSTAATVTRDSISAGTKNSGSSTISFSHTASGANPYLVVGVFIRYDEDVSTVTFNGANLTLLGTVDHGSSTVEAEVWGGFVPAGTANVTVTLGTGAGHFGAGAISYLGVDPTTPVGTPVTGSGTSTSAAANNAVAGTAARVFALTSYAGEGTITPTGTGITAQEIESGLGDAAGAWWDIPGEGDNSVNATATLGASVNWATIAVPILPDLSAPGAPTSVTASNTGSSTGITGATMPAAADTAFYYIRRKTGSGQSFSGVTDGTLVQGKTGTSPNAAISNIPITGLSASTAYTVGWFAEDLAGNISTAGTASFTTASSDSVAMTTDLAVDAAPRIALNNAFEGTLSLTIALDGIALTAELTADTLPGLLVNASHEATITAILADPVAPLLGGNDAFSLSAETVTGVTVAVAGTETGSINDTAGARTVVATTSDTSSVTDTSTTISRASSVTDTVAFTEETNVEKPLDNVTENLTFTEAVSITVTTSATDTNAGADNASLLQNVLVAATDAHTAADNQASSNASTVTDSLTFGYSGIPSILRGANVDSASVTELGSIFSTNMIVGSESVFAIDNATTIQQFDSQEEYFFAEAGTQSVVTAASDTTSAADSGVVSGSAAPSTFDTATTIETPSIQVQTAAATESVSVPEAASPAVSITRTETTSGADVGAVAANIPASVDSATILETATASGDASRSASDGITANDQRFPGFGVVLTSTEAGTEADNTSLLTPNVNVSDLVNLTEATTFSIQRLAADTIAFGETSRVVHIATSDSMFSNENSLLDYPTDVLGDNDAIDATDNRVLSVLVAGADRAQLDMETMGRIQGKYLEQVRATFS